jgi:hypothetical protein
VQKVKQAVAQGNLDDNAMAAAGDDASKKLAKLIEHLKARVAAQNDDSPDVTAFLRDKINALAADNRQLVGTVNSYIGNRDKKQPALASWYAVLLFTVGARLTFLSLLVIKPLQILIQQ